MRRILWAVLSYYAILFAVVDLTISLISSCPDPEKPEQQTSDNDDKKKGCTLGQSNIVRIGGATFRFAGENDKALVGGGTVLLVLVTLFLVVFTARLWVSTRDLVADTSKNARRQLRAYVNPDSIILWDGTTLTPPQPQRANVPGIVMQWRNTGETPAKNVVSWSRVAVFSPRVEDRYNPPARLDNRFSHTLGRGIPGSRSVWYRRALTPQQIVDVRTGRLGIYFYGRIEYQDIFGRPHWTTYKFVYTTSVFPPIGGGMFNICLSGNDSDDDED